MPHKLTILTDVKLLCPQRTGHILLHNLRECVNRNIIKTYADGIAMADYADFVVWGFREPEKIKSEASNWNLWVRQNLSNAVSEADIMHGELNSAKTKALLYAAMAAHDVVTPRATHLVFNLLDTVIGHDHTWQFQTIIRDKQLQDILDHPEDYALAGITIE